MATFIPGITDYVPQIQPFQPDYNFLGNMLQTKQGKYDAAHKQLNSIYGTILNSPMLRDSDIKRRDEFFKTVDGDIKRISGLDLSLQQNVDQAMSVFKPFYEDKNMMNDIATTKKAYAQINKHEQLKNCLDPAKCGGSAWDTGLAEINYKMDEYKKTTDDEALKFNMPTYTPYYDWQKEAVKLAATAGLKVTQDKIGGPWIVRQQNGTLVEGGLYGLFKSTYGNDPRVQANYNTQAYVDRKGYIQQNAQKHGSEEAAEFYYLNSKIADFNKIYAPITEEIKDATESSKARKNQLTEKEKTGGGATESELDILNRINGVVDNLDKTQNDLEVINNTVNNNVETKDLATLRRKGDFSAAQLLMNNGLSQMAHVMSMNDMQATVSVNPYHMEGVQQANKKDMALFNWGIDKAKMVAKLGMDMELAEFKAGLVTGIIGPKGQAGASQVTILPNEEFATEAHPNPYGEIQQSEEELAKVATAAHQGSGKFLFDTYNKAVQAAKNGSVGAIQYLKSIVGPGWVNINSQEELEKKIQAKNRTLETAFDYTKDALSVIKSPFKDIAWAQSHMNTNAKVIQNIDLDNEAYYATIKHKLAVSKIITQNMQASSRVSGNEIYKDADLLLSKNGIPLIAEEMPTSFAANYINRYRNDPDAYKNAKKIYGSLRDAYMEKSKFAKGVVANQGVGKTGANKQSANSAYYTGVNSKVTRDPGTILAKSILGTLIPDENSYTVNVGKPTEKNIEAGDLAILKPYLAQYYNKMNNPAEKNVAFNFLEAVMAGGDKDKSSITIYPGNDPVFKDAIGTKSSQGPLYALKDVIPTGISMVYNNKTVNTPTSRTAGLSSKEIVAMYQGLPVNQFPNALKNTKFTYDNSTRKYILHGTMISYKNGVKQFNDITQSIAPGALDKTYDNVVDAADKLQNENLKAEARLAQVRKNANTK